MILITKISIASAAVAPLVGILNPTKTIASNLGARPKVLSGSSMGLSGNQLTYIPDFSTRPEHIQILITGYDPFAGLYDREFHSSNSSGN